MDFMIWQGDCKIVSFKVAYNRFQHLDFNESTEQLFFTWCYNHGIKKLPNHWRRHCYNFRDAVGYHSNSMLSLTDNANPAHAWRLNLALHVAQNVCEPTKVGAVLIRDIVWNYNFPFWKCGGKVTNNTIILEYGHWFFLKLNQWNQ